MNASAIAQERETFTRADQAHGLRSVRFEGALTAATAPRVKAQIRDCVQRGDVRLLIDLQAVTAIDAAGVAALLDSQRVVECYAEGALVLRPNRIVRQALKESGTVAAFALWNGSGM
jgi:anti-anti-sigma factor